VSVVSIASRYEGGQHCQRGGSGITLVYLRDEACVVSIGTSPRQTPNIIIHYEREHKPGAKYYKVSDRSGDLIDACFICGKHPVLLQYSYQTIWVHNTIINLDKQFS
jgi:hypothetical protein